MDTFQTYLNKKLPLVGLFLTIFIVYINIAWIPWDLRFNRANPLFLCLFFVFRFGFFWLLISMLLKYNLKKLADVPFPKRLWRNFLFSLVAYIIYFAFSFPMRFWGFHVDCLGSILIFQFCVICLLCTFIGYILMLNRRQQEREEEIERLRVENLQSRCDALTNQINPHFFFNSLNGISALIRKKNDENTLMYVHKLSDIFRYILQSDRKGVVSLREELDFIRSFQYVMEVRFANKLTFSTHVDERAMDDLSLPVLSLLPLVDNVINHNRIDSEHKMTIDISLNTAGELVVSNPVYPKLTPSFTNGTGLDNLEKRFMILMNKQIRVVQDDGWFRVYLPLK